MSRHVPPGVMETQRVLASGVCWVKAKRLQWWFTNLHLFWNGMGFFYLFFWTFFFTFSLQRRSTRGKNVWLGIQVIIISCLLLLFFWASKKQDSKHDPLCLMNTLKDKSSLLNQSGWWLFVNPSISGHLHINFAILTYIWGSSEIMASFNVDIFLTTVLC